jgi:hypothetical protein
MSLSRWLYQGIPKPQLRAGATGQLRRPVERVIVIARLPNPTFDYYFAARIAAPGQPPAVVASTSDFDGRSLNPDGAFVVFCRYATLPVLSWIRRHRDRLAGVALFLDDDIPAMVADPEQDIGYRLYLFRLAIAPLPLLNRELDLVYASTEPLRRRLAPVRPLLLPPAPGPAMFEVARPPRSDGPVRIVFHAHSSHRGEHGFLRPVIEAVLRARPQVTVEVAAYLGLRTIWQDVTGVTVVDQIDWPGHLARTRAQSADIALIPLEDGPANAVRSDTKRIDVARLGAAGIFAASAPYGAASTVDELILPQDPVLWRDTLIRLIDDPGERARRAEATLERVRAMAARADAGLPIGLPRSLTG